MRVEGKAVKQRTSHHLVRCGIIDIIRYYALLNMKGRGITRMCQVTKRTKYNICTCDPPVPSQPANLKSTVKQTAYKDKSKKSLPRSWYRFLLHSKNKQPGVYTKANVPRVQRWVLRAPTDTPVQKRLFENRKWRYKKRERVVSRHLLWTPQEQQQHRQQQSDWTQRPRGDIS